jgi:Domain of unknown function DUF11
VHDSAGIREQDKSTATKTTAWAPNTTWTVRLTVKVTAAAGSVITVNAATMADTFDPNLANNMATATVKVQ